MNIVYVYADNPQEWNCSEWRCAVPARAFNRSRRHSAALISIEDFSQNTPAARQACEAAQVIVVQRNLFGPVLNAIQHWKARDKLVLADFDDAYQLMPASNMSAAFWNKGIATGRDGKPMRIQPPPLTQFKWGLRLVHAATTPSRRLADDFAAFGEMHYLPNYIDMAVYENCLERPADTARPSLPGCGKPVVIGWGGSISHLQSFIGSGVVQALGRVARLRPNVRVMICGADNRILEQLPIPAGQLIHQPWRPYREWPSVLSYFDIGLAPLSGDYDERRSWIKVLEYLVMKIPWVASDGPAYADLRPYGWLVHNETSAWERVLLDMVDHLDAYRQEAAGAPYLYGISQSIDENLERIVELYSALYERAFGAPALRPRPAAGGFAQTAARS
jgi:hypothetical protein